VGNINPIKGYEYFIQTAALVKKQIEGIRFVIVGAVLDTQKRYYQKLQNMILSLQMERDIVFAGRTDNVPEMLSIFDVFMLPSISEGGPRVTLEAMAMEKPVVATDVGAVPEQIVNGETGIIVPPRDPGAMAEAVIYLLEHPAEASTMGKKARPRVIELFSLDICVAQYITLYHQVMSRKR
jgi:glycosyltransferase involved in cell wall biosynthesis